jgi:hypothetical protein
LRMEHILTLDLKEKHNMDVEQFTIIKNLLEEIKDLLKEQQANQQPTTKITVLGNGQGQNTTKGLKSTEDFQF